MINNGHIGLTISMTLFLLLPTLALAQSPFSYIPVATTLAPTASAAVDIVVEPQTYTPDFYQGRAEPISGSRLKLVAIPNAEIAAESVSYRWQVTGVNLSGEPKAESQNITIDIPIGSALTVKVEIFNQAGRIIAANTETIRIGDMELAFYENNALRGQSQIAIDDELIMVGDEVGVIAVPYFSNPADLTGNLNTYWSVGDREWAPENPWELVLERSDLTRDVLINFSVQNRQTLENADRSFNLKL